MLNFTLIHPKATQAMLGLIPSFLSPNNPAPAKEQIDANYQHGGGWRKMEKWKYDPKTKAITYPGDESRPEHLLAEARLRDELILIYTHAWVCIVQPDGYFEVARVD